MWPERLADSPQLQPLKIALRPARPLDTVFLENVYGSTREPELAVVPWPDEAKRAFIAHQFRAQDESCRKNYPGAEFLVITVAGDDAGRLYLHDRADEIRIMDIALLPAFRRRGIGGALLRAILTEGSRTAKRVTIHVEIFNPARRLYDRLGFREVANPTADPVYRLLECRPPLTPAG